MHRALIMAAVALLLAPAILGKESNDCNKNIFRDEPKSKQLNSDSSFTLDSFDLSPYPLSQGSEMTISLAGSWASKGK